MITQSELEPLVAAWNAGRDATFDQQVQQMVAAETQRVHQAFERLPIRVQFIDVDPYGSFEEMRDQVQSTGTMLVWTGASETPLWDAETNWKARAVHDWDHIIKSCDFSMEGEAAAARYAAQCRPGLAPVYLSEIMLQAAVANYTGQFAEQKLVVLPEPLQRHAMSLRGTHPDAMTELVWDTASLLRVTSPEATMVHLSARGIDADTAVVVLDAAQMLNQQVDAEAAAAADEERYG